MKSIAIRCTTCQTTLRVRDESSIGQLAICPKCGSMVHIKLPDAEARAGDVSGDIAADAGKQAPRRRRVLGRKRKRRPEPTVGPVDATAAGLPGAESSSAPIDSTDGSGMEVDFSKPSGLGDDAPTDSTPFDETPPVPLTPDDTHQTASRIRLRRSLVMLAVAASLITVVVARWRSIHPGGSTVTQAAGARDGDESAVSPAAERADESAKPDDGPADAGRFPGGLEPGQHSQPTEGSPESLAMASGAGETVPRLRLDHRWLPRRTWLVASFRLSALYAQEDHGNLDGREQAVWNAVVAPVLWAFRLQPEGVERFTWAVAAGDDSSRQTLLFIELAEPLTAQRLGETRGEMLKLEVNGVACRRFTSGAWRQPFVIVEQRILITGPVSLMEELSQRSADDAPDRVMGGVLETLNAGYHFLMAADLNVARQRGWGDIEPGGFDDSLLTTWRAVRDSPTALAVGLHKSDGLRGELLLYCSSKSTAAKLHGSLLRLIETTARTLREETDELTERLIQGEITTATADQLHTLFRHGRLALEHAASGYAEIGGAGEDGLVWVRSKIDGDLPRLAQSLVAAIPSWEARRLVALRDRDAAQQQRVLRGLGGYTRGEGNLSYPSTAGGATLLQPEMRLSWIASLLPYYGHIEWYQQLDFRRQWDDRANAPIARRKLDAYINPAFGPRLTDDGFHVTHYVGITGLGTDAAELSPRHRRAGVFGNRPRSLRDIGDGASTTIAVMGVSQQLGPWAQGGRATARALTERPYFRGPDGFGSGQPNGMLAGMLDGSVRFISKDIDPHVLELMVTINSHRPADLADRRTAQLLLASRPDSPLLFGRSQPTTRPLPPKWIADAVDADQVDATVRKQLHMPLEEVEFQQPVPLSEWLEVLGDMVAVEVTLDLDALAEVGVSPDDPLTVHLSRVSVVQLLDTVLASRGLAYVTAADGIRVTSRQTAETMMRAVRYDVSDLVTEARDVPLLAVLIRRLVEPASWGEDAGGGDVVAGIDSLLVRHNDAVLRHVDRLLGRLRLARATPPEAAAAVLASRFRTAVPLLQRQVSTLFAEPTPLTEILATWQRESGGNLFLDAAALRSEGLSPDMETVYNTSELHLADALDSLLAPLGMTHQVVSGSLILVTTETAADAHYEVEFYKVAHLLEGQTPESLIARIQTEVVPASWSGEGGSAVLYLDVPSRCLIVRQTQQSHRRLEQWLTLWNAADETAGP